MMPLAIFQFMTKLFAIKVRDSTTVTKSCILDEAGFKMNDYLTYLRLKVLMRNTYAILLFLSLNFGQFHHLLEIL